MGRGRERQPPILPGDLRAGGPMDRRVFVQTAGGILIAASGLGGSCTDNLPYAGPFGTLTVKVIGLATSPAPADGGNVVVTVSAGGATQSFPGTLPADGQVTADVPPGSYEITYTPPSGYLLASGETSSKTVQVTGSQAAEVDFTVVAAGAATGTLTVVVTGLGRRATSGGSVSVLRTDVGGQTPHNSAVPASGSVSFTLTAGTYTVAYTAPAGYTVAAGTTNPQTGVVVPADGSVQATFAVTASTSTGTLTITVSGLGGNATSGGSVSVLRTDIGGQTPQDAAMPANGTLTLTLAAGTYAVTYTPPSGYVVSAGTTNPQTGLVVPAGGSAQASFAVTAGPASGTLSITVTGLGGNAGTGGSVSVLRTDIAGQTAQNVTIPASGSLNLTVTAGTYTVTYTPPGGYTLNAGVTNPQTGLAVPAGGSVTATFSVTTQSGTGVTGNIYEFGFEDGTVGAFRTGNGQPIGAPWVLDSTLAYRGTRSIKQVYAPSGGSNTGEAFYYSLPGSRTSYYCRFAYRQSNPFNNNGGTNNANQVKVQRGLGPGFNGQYGSFFIGQGGGMNGVPTFGWDGLDSSPYLGDRGPNVNTPGPNFNNLLGQWVVVETYWDISTSGALKFMCWINGVLYFNYTDNKSNRGVSYGVLQFDGTINSMASTSTAWFDTIGISSAPMGYPPP
jgi:hypothetical protein